MDRKIYGILIFGVALVLGCQLVPNVMYNYQLSEFYQSGRESSPDVNYEWFQRHGISINGNATSAQVINVRDLLAYPEGASGSSPQKICRDVKSSSGSVTISFIGEYAICCQLADEDQWLVPFKDEGDYRHYLCGKWPNTDHVIQKISKSKLKLESDSQGDEHVNELSTFPQHQ